MDAKMTVGINQPPAPFYLLRVEESCRFKLCIHSSPICTVGGIFLLLIAFQLFYCIGLLGLPLMMRFLFRLNNQRVPCFWNAFLLSVHRLNQKRENQNTTYQQRFSRYS